MAELLRTASLLLATGLVATTLAQVVRLPAMILLVLGGVLVGPSGAGWLDVPLDATGAQLVFSVGVSMILFHGGTGISLRVIRETAVSLALLALPGVMLTAAVVAVAVAPLFDVSYTTALLVGAVLASTDPAIVIPLFDRLGIRPKVAQTIVAESAFNDPTGTVLALTLATIVSATGASQSRPVLDFAQSLALGGVLGIVGGVALAVLLSDRRIGVWSESPAAAILMVVALEYFANEEVGGSGYLAAFLAGLIVGNMDVLRLGQDEQHASVLEGFVAQVAEIVVLAVFVVLGVNLPLGDLADAWWQGLVVMAVFILVARPLCVAACLLPDRRARWTRQEAAFLAWSRYTGVVPAAVASLLSARAIAEPNLAEGARISVTLVAMAVCTTLLLQATTAGALARRLGLVDETVPDEG